MSSTEFAIPLALLTTTAFNTGLIVEKRALGTLPPLQLNQAGRTLISLVTTPAWLAGLSLMLTGMGLQVIVLAIEPISVVQPILASGVALTLVLSRLVLRERLGGAENWCVAIMAGSLVLLALSQDAASNQATRGANPLAMAGVVVPALALGVLAASWPWRHGGGRNRPAGTAMLAGVGVGLLYGVSALASKGLSSVVGGGHAPAHLVTGLLSSPYLYLLFGCSAIAMLLYQTALQACRASVLIPVSNVVSSGFFVIVGTWLFHEQLPASPVKLGLRLAGIAAAGVVLVILGIQSRGAEAIDQETELADVGITAQTLAMAGSATGPQRAAPRRTGPQPVLDRITGPQPLAVLRRTGPQSAAARATGPQLMGSPVAELQPVAAHDADPEPGYPVGREPGRRIGPHPARRSGPQPAAVRGADLQTAVGLSLELQPVDSLQHVDGLEPLDGLEPAGALQTTAAQPAGSQTWLSQATSGLLRAGRPRGRHEKSRTGKTGVLSRD